MSPARGRKSDLDDGDRVFGLCDRRGAQIGLRQETFLLGRPLDQIQDSFEPAGPALRTELRTVDEKIDDPDSEFAANLPDDLGAQFIASRSCLKCSIAKALALPVYFGNRQAARFRSNRTGKHLGD